MSLRAAGFLSLVCLFAQTVQAARTDGTKQVTYWDQLMEVQSRKWLFRGSQRMRGGQYEDAVREFSKSVLAQPNDSEAHRMLGVAYYWAGRVDDAEIEVKESIHLEPKSAQSHLLLGIIRAYKGEMELAYSSFKRAGRFAPKRADIQMNLGSMEETMGLYPEALAHFRRAAELEPKHPLYHFQLGLLYRRLGRDEEAIDSFKKATRLFAGFEDAWLELGALYERNGEKKKALHVFEKSVQLKKRDSVARFRLARLYLDRGRIQDARDTLRDAFHLTPADAAGGLALSLSFGGKPSPAERAKGRPPHKRNEQGKSSEASPPKGPADVLERNLERIPLDQNAVLNIDVAFIPKPKMIEHEKRDGSSSLKSALENAGKMPRGTMLGAQREYKLDAADSEGRARQIQAIMTDLRTVLDSAPPDAETRFGMNLNFTGEGGGAGALPKGAKAKVAYQPRDVGNDMGLWVKGTGWMVLVQDVLTGPDERMPHAEDSNWWSVEGVGLAILGQADLAGEAFRKALELDPENEIAHLGVGVARVISGDEEGAVRSYRKALEINPKNRTAEQGLKWLLRESSMEEKK